MYVPGVFRDCVKLFPKPVQAVMREKDIAATCIPVQFDDEQWQAAFFFHVAGPESKQDRRILKKNKVTPAILMVELMSHAKASIIMMRVEIQTVIDDPLVFEILLVPGEVSTHHECLKLLARQTHIRYFFADSDYRVLQEQQQTISNVQHEQFETLAREAFARDSLMRIAGNYDAQAALSEVVAHYHIRTGADENGKGTPH